MRIIKRGRRHIVISPSELPTDDTQAQPKPRSAGTPIVRFDQLPIDLQRALKSRPAADTLRVK
jgi:hypothetical protein